MSRSTIDGAQPGRGRRVLLLALLVSLVPAAACREVDLSLPSASAVEEAYLYHGDLSVAMSGNVAEITIVQPAQQLSRGGRLWAKVGPYVLLFSEETERLFRDYPGLAGVRVITTSSGREVARALLPRDSLNDVTWRRARHIAGLARRDGTRRPTLLEDLVQWGQEHTQYEYDPRYVGG